MKIIDLTYSAQTKTELQKLTVRGADCSFTCRIHHFSHNSMEGSYIDFPGHIIEADDGVDSENFPIENLFRVPACLIRLDRQDGSGAISKEELQTALGDKLKDDSKVQAIVINALGPRRFDDIQEHSVYFSADAVDWLVSRKFKLIVSDVYESRENPQNVFLKFFNAGILTVCYPINLDKLPDKVKITVMFPKFKSVTQLPCRIIAETE